ncbi:MAG: hypothetical protein RML40_06555 [Bacteroidota bacterium]|nr:hypothetical protein [Candidatus Kapabacteria bacterium]MDW8220177.1 hypothetical protein [Bacteroidota bacterium]
MQSVVWREQYFQHYSAIVAVITQIVLYSHTTIQAQSFRLGAGISTPFEHIVAIHFPLAQGGTYLYPVGQSYNTGYHLSARYLLSLESGRGFILSGTLHHFETPIFSVYDPSFPSVATSVKITHSLIPLGVGFEYRFLSLLILHAYCSGEASYNLLLSRYDYTQPTTGLIVTETAQNRIGASIALGLEAAVFGFGVDVSVRYHWVNIFLSQSYEPRRSFVSFNLSLILGAK